MNKFRTILLAEDSPKDVELTMEALSDNNIANHVVVANDGVEVMDFLHYEGKFKERKFGNPAVILLDIKMPRMDGIEVLKTIRNDPALKLIPVVMLTSSREEPDLKRCYELGASAYVVKPVNINEFMFAVKQVGVFWALINELPPDGGQENE